MSYSKLPWSQQIEQFDKTIIKVDSAILALQSQNLAVQARIMLRRAQMAKFDEKILSSEKHAPKFVSFNTAIESNAKLSTIIQNRIAALSRRLVSLKTNRAAALLANATKKNK